MIENRFIKCFFLEAKVNEIKIILFNYSMIPLMKVICIFLM